MCLQIQFEAVPSCCIRSEFTLDVQIKLAHLADLRSSGQTIEAVTTITTTINTTKHHGHL